MNWQLFMWHWVLSFQGLCILDKFSATELLSHTTNLEASRGYLNLLISFLSPQDFLESLTERKAWFLKIISGTWWFSVTCCSTWHWRSHTRCFLLTLLHDLQVPSLPPVIVIEPPPIHNNVFWHLLVASWVPSGLLMHLCVHPAGTLFLYKLKSVHLAVNCL